MLLAAQILEAMKLIISLKYVCLMTLFSFKTFNECLCVFVRHLCKWKVQMILSQIFFQALQKVNKCLLEKNAAESLLFDVVLITTDRRRQQQSSRLINSTRHYGNLPSADRSQLISPWVRCLVGASGDLFLLCCRSWSRQVLFFQ